MEIYLLGTRMFMIMDVEDSFLFRRRRRADAANAKVQEWETIMRGFQQRSGNPTRTMVDGDGEGVQPGGAVSSRRVDVPVQEPTVKEKGPGAIRSGAFMF